MGKLAALRRIATSWYIALLFFGALGIVLGYFVFFNVFPGKPKIGVIDIPFTVITDDSAFEISAFLDYAGRTKSIKAVVIRLNSPGGGAAASEQVFLETSKLREKKPVVIIMDSIVASGAYMMSMGADYTYAKPTSLVGSVGVILSFPGPLIPDLPDERIVVTGPFKLGGGTRRHWIELLEQVKQSFAQMVITQRGDKLLLSPEELTSGRIYPGVEAVRLGLVDGIGSDTKAIEKAASLAGIHRYELVDVNIEVFRLFVQKFRRIFEASEGGGTALGTADARFFIPTPKGSVGPADSAEGSGTSGTVIDIAAMRRLLLSGMAKEAQEKALPGLPLKVTRPTIYYLYVGPSQ